MARLPVGSRLQERRPASAPPQRLLQPQQQTDRRAASATPQAVSVQRLPPGMSRVSSPPRAGRAEARARPGEGGTAAGAGQRRAKPQAAAAPAQRAAVAGAGLRLMSRSGRIIKPTAVVLEAAEARMQAAGAVTIKAAGRAPALHAPHGVQPWHHQQHQQQQPHPGSHLGSSPRLGDKRPAPPQLDMAALVAAALPPAAALPATPSSATRSLRVASQQAQLFAASPANKRARAAEQPGSRATQQPPAPPFLPNADGGAADGQLLDQRTPPAPPRHPPLQRPGKQLHPMLQQLGKRTPPAPPPHPLLMQRRQPQKQQQQQRKQQQHRSQRAPPQQHQRPAAQRERPPAQLGQRALPAPHHERLQQQLRTQAEQVDALRVLQQMQRQRRQQEAAAASGASALLAAAHMQERKQGAGRGRGAAPGPGLAQQLADEDVLGITEEEEQDDMEQEDGEEELDWGVLGREPGGAAQWARPHQQAARFPQAAAQQPPAAPGVAGAASLPQLPEASALAPALDDLLELAYAVQVGWARWALRDMARCRLAAAVCCVAGRDGLCYRLPPLADRLLLLLLLVVVRLQLPSPGPYQLARHLRALSQQDQAEFMQIEWVTTPPLPALRPEACAGLTYCQPSVCGDCLTPPDHAGVFVGRPAPLPLPPRPPPQAPPAPVAGPCSYRVWRKMAAKEDVPGLRQAMLDVLAGAGEQGAAR